MTTTVFSPPASCFTSVWASNTPLEGLVYETVGCPALDVTSVPSSLSACCGPFSDYSGLLIATLTGCPEGYGAVSSHIATVPDPQFDFADFWCCPTAYGWTGKCQLSPTNAFSPGGPATVTITYANELYVTWTGSGAVAASTTAGESSQDLTSLSLSTMSTGTSSTAPATQQSSTSSAPGMNSPGPGTQHSSGLPSRDIAGIVVPVVFIILSAIAFAFHYSRKRRAAAEAEKAAPVVVPFTGPQMKGTELDSSPVQELQSESRPFELQGSEPRRIKE